MLRYVLSASFLFASAAFVCAAQSSSGSSQPSQSQPAASASAPTTPPAGKTAGAKELPSDKDPAKAKKKVKKVWTEDDISKVGGGGISVVGDASTSSASRTAPERSGASSDSSTQNNDIQYYREQLRQLQAQLDAADKKLGELRNFKGDNTTASGGINPNNGYTMTPVSDQIKQMEDKKKQIQDQMDAVMDEARKKGIEPGQLR
ncbi:MAG: hypothetical protein WA789_11530 [Candidatus Acidiferrum sp.]